jgi:hypothetical protein
MRNVLILGPWCEAIRPFIADDLSLIRVSIVLEKGIPLIPLIPNS